MSSQSISIKGNIPVGDEVLHIDIKLDLYYAPTEDRQYVLDLIHQIGACLLNNPGAPLRDPNGRFARRT